MVNSNNDAYYFGRFGTVDYDVSETGSGFIMDIVGENAVIHLRSLEATALKFWTNGE
jgi:hypothetical protein